MPNQPKYPGRHLRMDAPRWEGFGIHSAAHAGDRTKELVQIIDWLLYAPDAKAPERIPPSELIAGLRAAAAETDREAEQEPSDKKRKALCEKAQAQRDMANLVAERTRAARA
ncbi:hypothetical protein [Nonomuraea indica]|uniref:hypothetical protein n=1 Tax=Nonomuraea indica TaxID=1581193 RepID=UPI0011845F46|nr:hypothetical protein [Nonomuraea indica]